MNVGNVGNVGIAGIAGETTLLWTRPLGAALLLVPLLLLVAAWIAPELTRLPTGALGLWRRAAESTAGGRSRRGIDPRWLLLVASTLLGAVAFCGPVLLGAESPRTWVFLVDRSPSMYLASPGGGTRLDAAVEAALEELAEEREPGDAVLWRSGDTTRAGPGIPESWRTPPRELREAPDFELLDQEGCIWITDARPEVEPENAGVAASGGAAAPGAIAFQGGSRTIWDGRETSERTGFERPRVAVVGRLEPTGAADRDPLTRMVRAWARARGFDLDFDPDPEASGTAQLVLATATSPGRDPLALRVGRDGWSATVQVPAAAAPDAGVDLGVDGLETWLEAETPSGAPLRVVSAGPGRVEVLWSGMDEPEGDPAAFAVSWGDLLDAAALAPEGVIPLRERLDAGEPLSRPGRPPRRTGARDALDFSPWLAALAALLAALACIGAR